MRYISKQDLLDRFLFLTEKAERTVSRTEKLENYHDFISSPEQMDLFDATCMRLQVVGEMLKQIDDITKGELLKTHYPEIPWRKVIGMRNMISHEYASIDPEIVFDIVKHNLIPLIEILKRVIDDIQTDRFDFIK